VQADKDVTGMYFLEILKVLVYVRNNEWTFSVAVDVMTLWN